jgi:isopenicillin-N epimerase
MEREPVQFMCHELEPRLDAVREEVARFVGADPEGLAFVPNATTGVNAVLGSLEFRPGDELLTTDHAYGACRCALEHVAERAGARVTVAEIGAPVSGPDAVVQTVLERVTPRTRLALLDHVTSPTGLVFPLERLVAELAARGVPTLVDGAHGPGMCPLDLCSLGAAAYTGNGHKWCCAPKGAAFLWVHPELRDTVRPSVISHGAGHAHDLRPRFRQEFDWTGTHDPTAVLCFGEAIRVVGGLVPGGWEEIRRRNRALALIAHELLPARLAHHGVTPVGPAEMVGFMVAFRIPDHAPGPLPTAMAIPSFQRELFDRHRIEVPVVPWPRAPHQVLRTSSHLYNDRDELDHLADALDERLGG